MVADLGVPIFGVGGDRGGSSIDEDSWTRTRAANAKRTTVELGEVDGHDTVLVREDLVDDCRYSARGSEVADLGAMATRYGSG